MMECLQLRTILSEASEALARLDADRLEEMAFCCESLAGETLLCGSLDPLRDDRRKAEDELTVLRKLLKATRSNLAIVNGIGAERGSRLEYGDNRAIGSVGTEGDHGND